MCVWSLVFVLPLSSLWCSLSSCCPAPLLHRPPFTVFAVTALLVWVCVFVAGLCYCGMAVVVYACVGMAGCVMVCGVSSLSSPFSCLLVFFFVLVFGVVRAQLCEHARYPRTPLCSLVVLSSLCLAPAFLHHPFFFLLEWRWVIHHVSECSVGMTAMGSLSRSSSFFW